MKNDGIELEITDDSVAFSGLTVFRGRSGLVGDNFTRFEEYRGFITRGVHRRTSPLIKDLFTATTVSRVRLTYAQSPHPPGAAASR
jgi:hypothetical protein